MATGSAGYGAIASCADGFELRCAGVHAVRCGVALRGSSRKEVVELARAHGASAHGFTPAWYSSRRVAAMTAAVTAAGGAR
jgi:predicted small metal-binding protein